MGKSEGKVIGTSLGNTISWGQARLAKYSCNLPEVQLSIFTGK